MSPNAITPIQCTRVHVSKTIRRGHLLSFMKLTIIRIRQIEMIPKFRTCSLLITLTWGAFIISKTHWTARLDFLRWLFMYNVCSTFWVRVWDGSCFPGSCQWDQTAGVWAHPLHTQVYFAKRSWSRRRRCRGLSWRSLSETLGFGWRTAGKHCCWWAVQTVLGPSPPVPVCNLAPAEKKWLQTDDISQPECDNSPAYLYSINIFMTPFAL